MHENLFLGALLFGIAIASGLITLYLLKKAKGHEGEEPSDSMLAFLALKQRGERINEESCEQERRINRLQDMLDSQRRGQGGSQGRSQNGRGHDDR